MLVEPLIEPGDLLVEGLDHRETGGEAGQSPLHPLQPAGMVLQHREHPVELGIEPAHPGEGMVAAFGHGLDHTAFRVRMPSRGRVPMAPSAQASPRPSSVRLAPRRLGPVRQKP